MQWVSLGQKADLATPERWAWVEGIAVRQIGVFRSNPGVVKPVFTISAVLGDPSNDQSRVKSLIWP